MLQDSSLTLVEGEDGNYTCAVPEDISSIAFEVVPENYASVITVTVDGETRKMAGVIPGKVFRTDRLGRFGYITLQQKQPVLGKADLGGIPAHEFHYFDSENCGESFAAQKPMSSRSWNCIHGSDRMMAGFPHLYYHGNPKVARAFLTKCLEYKRENKKE